MKEIEPVLTDGGDSAENSSWNAAGVYGRLAEWN
jgi:hypothetical protein